MQAIFTILNTSNQLRETKTQQYAQEIIIKIQSLLFKF